MPMTMGKNKTEQVEMYVMSSKDPRPDGSEISVDELVKEKKFMVGAANESTQQSMIDVACGWKVPAKPWKGPDGRRAESRKMRKNRRKKMRLWVHKRRFVS